MFESGETGVSGDQSLRTDDLPHIVWVATADRSGVRLNRFGREFLGPASNEASAESWLRRVHPDDAARVRRAWERAAACGELYEIEYRLARADAEHRWIVERGQAQRDAEGRIVRWIGTCTEIEEQKRALESVRESRHALAREKTWSDTLLASLPGMVVFVVDRDGRLVRWNREFEAFLGRSGDELLGTDLLLPAVDEDRALLGRKMGDLIDHGGFDRVEARVRDARSEVHAYIFSGQRVELGSEHYLVGTGLDVTDLRRAEEQQARLGQAVEQTTDSIVITDTAGAILYVNPAFERITGFSRSEAIGQNPRILKSEHQDAAFYKRMWDTLARGEVWTGRLVNRRKDGSLFEEDATIGPVRDAAGRLVNYVAVKRDVTNETRLERQFLQAQKMEAIGRLAGGVAHDFNNLLGVVMGYAEITRRRLPPADPLREKVDQILKAAERATSLTRQLLAFSRQQVLQPRVVNLNGIVSEMEKMLRRLIGEDVELTTVLDPLLGNVKADPGQIEQVLMNLAVNARDAMPQGGRLTIETKNADLDADYVARHPLARVGCYVMLAVSDTGEGMNAETQSRVFEPFFTTKELGKGTGLGLATVYGIVKQSEGYIWLYSEVGIGTTFKIYLPRVEAALTPARRRELAPLPRGVETLLLVEDEPSLRDLLCETLREGGYTVLVARDGSDAVQIAEDHAGVIHLVVTDVIMPGMTGRSVVERIAPARPETKVLYISGYADAAIEKHGVLSPGSAFLSKPFAPDQLLRKVRELLETR